MNQSGDSFIAKFFRQESAAGILLIIAATIAIALANSPLEHYYKMLLHVPVEIRISGFAIDKPLLLWVNDGLMAIFFLLISLELKREFHEGELSNRRFILLPGLGAIGGMAIPAAIYLFLNRSDPTAMNGWAIPASTDIAFALGVLSLLGKRVPTGLKVFLTSLAIFDDIGAILIIAFFYTSKISLAALAVSGVCIVILFCLNRFRVYVKSLYLLTGLVMWAALVKSGVHATLAGVILGMFIPNKVPAGDNTSPLRVLEQDIHAAVVFIILPLFAFCNSGINFEGIGWEQIFHNVTLGIFLGLFLGNQLGVILICWIGIKLGITELPKGATWASFYGTAILCGIGFTMSLFIGSLAFEETGIDMMFDERLGIIMGSLVSGLWGYLILRLSLRKSPVST